MPSYPINYNLYTYFWKKYKPVILKLMVDSDSEPQNYQFISHEFKDINVKEKGGHTFTLEAFKGKAQNNIKPSVVAQDLLLTLQKSSKALELMETATYEFVLDKQLVLHVSKVQDENVEAEIEEVAGVEAGMETTEVAVEPIEASNESEEEVEKPNAEAVKTVAKKVTKPKASTKTKEKAMA